MKIKQLSVFLIFFISCGSPSHSPRLLNKAKFKAEKQVQWIDVHFHLIGTKNVKAEFEEAARNAVEIMDGMNMRMIVVMSPPRPRQNYDYESLATAASIFPNRIAFLGGGGTLNPMLQAAGHQTEVSLEMRDKFGQIAEDIIASGAKGFGEIAIHHVSLGATHAYESIPADHELLLLLSDIAARNDVVMDIHLDPIPKDVKTPAHLIARSELNPPILKENLSAFERLLTHNRKTKIVWAHAGSDPVGFFTPQLARKMLEKHPNLHMSIRPLNKRPGSIYHPRQGVNREWMKVVRTFHDRFVMGTDSFLVASNATGRHTIQPRKFEPISQNQRQASFRLLSSIKPKLAHRIAVENAIRLYHLDE